MSAAILKTTFSIVTIIAVFALLQTTAALDAILLFAAAGEVPGTDIELTPAATMWTLGGAAVASILLIFSGSMVRRFRRRRQAKLAQAITAPVLAKQPKVARVKKVAAKPEVSNKPIVIITLPGKPGHISRAVRALIVAATGIAVIVREQAPLIGRKLASYAQYVLGVSRLYAACAWRYLEPRLARIGEDIAKKLNQPQDIKPFIELLRSCAKVASKWLADARTQILRYKGKLNF